MPAIRNKSVPDIKTNVRVADQLQTANIGWMIECISEERVARRAEAKAAGEEFKEDSKGQWNSPSVTQTFSERGIS